jgi:adenine-specific DNA-methyltransferase
MQFSLDYPVVIAKDAYDYGTRSDGGAHGLVLTKPHIVDLILDLCGYLPSIDLTGRRLLEPACGHGAFLLPAIDRLVTSAKTHGVQLSSLHDAVAAFDIEDDHVEITRSAIVELLSRHGLDSDSARQLAEHWVQRADFLLAPHLGNFDFVVGNPPYIRIEQLSPIIQAEYRRRYITLYDRADLYVAFIERSLRSLAPKGVVGFICADRWTLNKYGAPLREFVSQSYSVREYIDLHKTSPFESEVIAYPSIFVIANEPSGKPVRRGRALLLPECKRRLTRHGLQEAILGYCLRRSSLQYSVILSLDSRYSKNLAEPLFASESQPETIPYT